MRRLCLQGTLLQRRNDVRWRGCFRWSGLPAELVDGLGTDAFGTSRRSPRRSVECLSGCLLRLAAVDFHGGGGGAGGTFPRMGAARPEGADDGATRGILAFGVPSPVAARAARSPTVALLKFCSASACCFCVVKTLSSLACSAIAASMSSTELVSPILSTGRCMATRRATTTNLILGTQTLARLALELT
jgi:hypothetical protein